MHRILDVAVTEIVLGHDAVAVEMLLAADRQRARKHDPVDPAQARRLEAIVHADDVELGRDMRGVLAAEKIGEIDDARRFRGDGDRHDIVELRDVAAHDPDSVAELPVGCGAGVEVHAHDFFTALRQ